MGKVLLLLLIVASTCFAKNEVQTVSQPLPIDFQVFVNKQLIGKNALSSRSAVSLSYCKVPEIPLSQIRKILLMHTDTLSMPLINTVLTTIKCFKERNIHYNNILAVIDYSLPSNKKRLWIFDLRQKELLFYTYVSHGIKSGTITTNYFSNSMNSKASSLGIFMTEDIYYGRHGLSLKLLGLDRNINDKAYQRNIVMHAAWYTDSDFIKKYGRAGRSWGCPAVPNSLAKPIIETLKNQTLFIVYYPSSSWFLKSKFLTCDNLSLKANSNNLETMPSEPEEESRGDILFVDKNNDFTHSESEPILVMSVNEYQRIFNEQIPLKRMLRRQINNTEYIALNAAELRRLDSNNDSVINNDDQYGASAVDFVVAIVIKTRGYYATQFEFLNLGSVQQFKINSITDENTMQLYNSSSYTIRKDENFIRWLGL